VCPMGQVHMRTLYFLRGLPASGKTTWAKRKLATLNLGGKIRAVRTNKDEIRVRLRAKGVNSENKVIRRETELVTKALKAGLDVIIDNTHFKPIHEWQYRDLAKEYGHKFEIVSFTDVPLEECIRRDQERRNCVGGNVIRTMDDYRKSWHPGKVAALKKQWVTKKAAAAKKAAAVKTPAVKTPAVKTAAVQAAPAVAKKTATKRTAAKKAATIRESERGG